MAPEDAFQRELVRRELDAEPSAERLREMALELYDLWQRQRTVTTQLVRQELGRPDERQLISSRHPTADCSC